MKRLLLLALLATLAVLAWLRLAGDREPLANCEPEPGGWGW